MAAQESCIQINSSSLLFLLPPCLAQQFIWVRLLGVLARNDVIPGVSLLSSRGVVNWSLSCDPTSVALPAGATSPCLHLPALEHVGHLGFAVPPPGLMFSCFPCVSQLWVWCLQ